MLQGLAHTICVCAKKASGGGSDYTPNAVDWGNVSQVIGKFKIGTYVYSAQQITGISTTFAFQITLRVVFSNTAFASLRYKIQSTSTVPASNSQPTANGYFGVSHNGTISVTNNQWLVFAANGNAGSTTVTVINTSDSNAILDTFTGSCT